MPDPNRPALPFSPGLAVWFAMVGSIVFYAGIAVFLDRQQTSGPVVPWWPFAIAAIVCAWLAFLFHRSLAERSRSERRRAEAETGPMRVDPLQVRIWALDEAVGVIGVTAALLGGGLATFVPFGVAALALLLLHRPR
jgi:hypothetical protein